MTTATQEVPEGERLARIEATLELLLRQNSDIREEIRDVRKSSRSRFFWTLGVVIGLFAPTLAGLIMNFILNG